MAYLMSHVGHAHPPSFRRKPEGGFTFEVQHLIPEDLGWSEKAEALTWGIIIRPHELSKSLVGHRREVGLARQGAAHPSDGVLDAALLPRRVGVTEEGLDAEGMESMMPGELGAVVEGDSLAPRGGQGSQYLRDDVGDGVCVLAGGPGSNQQSGMALMQGEDRLLVNPEQHQVTLPMARRRAVLGFLGAFGEGTPQGDEASRTPTLAPAPATFRFGSGQIVAPGVVLRACELGVDEPVDGLVRDHWCPLLMGKPASDLLWRPTLGEPGQHAAAQAAVAIEA